MVDEIVASIITIIILEEWAYNLCWPIRSKNTHLECRVEQASHHRWERMSKLFQKPWMNLICKHSLVYIENNQLFVNIIYKHAWMLHATMHATRSIETRVECFQYVSLFHCIDSLKFVYISDWVNTTLLIVVSADVSNKTLRVSCKFCVHIVI